MKYTARIFYTSFFMVAMLFFYNCSDNQPKTNDADKTSSPNVHSKTLKLTVTNIVCQPCINTIRRELFGLKGINSVDVFLNQESNNVKIIYDDALVSRESITKVIEKTGRKITSIDEV